ncbi:proteasome alpha subunit, putative [Ichthyophthirius multifiliis]|uniref:Proteasome alpha subunit, putative n=1 Tax=Ichthyophthirius multifiliis TaxID=5932 RepID=G0QU93_ICHMU|nr:proteasome alpha subunit, putative [Ichthyophthirius multifiliis]EGR31210.1 proteasome alpha subunit, putative [Ichthyophthirius multifiliis]|eukprot:XP_004034696.1 proteasome alpha subunit, putative [Ichthyophthirius multifiliis]
MHNQFYLNLSLYNQNYFYLKLIKFIKIFFKIYSFYIRKNTYISFFVFNFKKFVYILNIQKLYKQEIQNYIILQIKSFQNLKFLVILETFRKCSFIIISIFYFLQKSGSQNKIYNLQIKNIQRQENKDIQKIIILKIKNIENVKRKVINFRNKKKQNKININSSNYDRSVNTFSKQGRLLQVENAMQAMKLGNSSIGIKVNEGVVLAVERKVDSTLMNPKSNEKISEIDCHIACAASGFIPDARTLVDYARVEAQNHRFTYNEPMNVRALTQTVSDLALNFGEGDPSMKRKPMSRPYGVALLIAGVDDSGPNLYKTDPSGTMTEYFAQGIGPADEGIQVILNEQYKQDLTLLEAEKLALNCLKQVMEEKINKKNVELCVISTANPIYTERSPEYVEEIIKNLQ